MDEMIRYIFGSLRCSETAIRMMSKTLQKQKSFNRSVAIFSMIATAHIILQGLEIRNMHQKIDTLKNEIKELNKTEGD